MEKQKKNKGRKSTLDIPSVIKGTKEALILHGENTSLDQIAKLSNQSKAAIVRKFGSKASLIGFILAGLHKEHITNIQKLKGKNRNLRNALLLIGKKENEVYPLLVSANSSSWSWDDNAEIAYMESNNELINLLQAICGERLTAVTVWSLYLYKLRQALHIGEKPSDVIEFIIKEMAL